ncbi:hypothetical protein [Streptomyces sp. HF10]|nr:hypothetical protein [Streptomyces sp. HF10]
MTIAALRRLLDEVQPDVVRPPAPSSFSPVESTPAARRTPR